MKTLAKARVFFYGLLGIKKQARYDRNTANLLLLSTYKIVGQRPI